MTEKIRLSSENMHSICGGLDENIKRIEKALSVDIGFREDDVNISGEQENVERAVGVLRLLQKQAERNETINGTAVDYAIEVSGENSAEENIRSLEKMEADTICHTMQGKPVKPKTLGQKNYVDAIRKNMIVFGLGPAGTGKTYLAMAMGITAFKNGEVSRIIMTRPAIEAGEKLGFLPGDLQSKVDPYLRPLYDALYQIMGAETFLKNMEKGLIEVAPLAYMRGRTLDNAFIILDEAQNTTPAQMKMFLTRIGFGSKVIITGDQTQKDLPQGQVSGLDVAAAVLKDIDEIQFCRLTSRDVVRHPLVGRIVKAYEQYEAKQEAAKGREKRRFSLRRNGRNK